MTKFYIVSTPIGNLADITLRAIETLRSADLIICENTLNSLKLLQKYNISKAKLSSYNDQSVEKERNHLINKIKQQDIVCLISDAGTPLIADPGYKLIRDLVALGIEVEAISGPTALIPALVLSGLPSDQFIFLGFLAKTKQLRYQAILDLKNYNSTAIIYESPKRVIDLLTLILDIHGAQVQVCVCKEISKLYENITRGTVGEVLTNLKAQEPLRGEYVVVIEAISAEKSSADIRDKYLSIRTGSSKDLASIIEKEEGISKSQAYDIALELKGIDGK